MQKSSKFRLFWTRAKQSARKNPWLFSCYWILRLMVVGIMTVQLIHGDYGNAFICILTLVLFMIPTFVEKRIKVDVPDALDIILLYICGTNTRRDSRIFLNVPGWDTMLHTVNGFLCAAVGIAMIDILNRHDKFSISMSPAFVALVACFSMTIGVLWEFFDSAPICFALTCRKIRWYPHQLRLFQSGRQKCIRYLRYYEYGDTEMSTGKW